jgi:hypothetical protein
MMPRRVIALVALSLGMLPGAAFAADPVLCRNGLFNQLEGIHLAKATPDATGKVHFRNDDSAKCPADASCAEKAYVVAGDQLLASKEYGGWVCAWYFSKKHEYVGWIRPTVSTPLPAHPPALADWKGDWTGWADVTLEPKPDGSIYVTGTAIWSGGNGNVHDGELDDTAKPVGNRLEIGDAKEEYACHVVFQLIGGYLLANDSGYCGGVNVSFSGVYRRSAKPSAARK